MVPSRARVGAVCAMGAELAPSGVHVVLIEPGMVSTRIWSTGAPSGMSLLAAAHVGNQPIPRPNGPAGAHAGHAAVRELPTSAVASVIAKAMTTNNRGPRPVLLEDDEGRLGARHGIPSDGPQLVHRQFGK